MQKREEKLPEGSKSFLKDLESVKRECVSLGGELASLRLRAPSSGAVFQVEAAERHVISTLQELDRAAAAVAEERARLRGESADRDEAQGLVRWFTWEKYPERAQRFSDVMKFFAARPGNEPVAIETLVHAFKWFPGPEEQQIAQTRSALDKIAEVQMLQREADAHRRPSYSLSEKAVRFIEKGFFYEAFGVGPAPAQEAPTS